MIVTMPDGTDVEFPDDMPRDEIRGMIEKKFPKQVEEYRNKSPEEKELINEYKTAQAQQLDVRKLNVNNVMSDDGLNSNPSSKIDMMLGLARMITPKDSLAGKSFRVADVGVRAVENTEWEKLAQEGAKSAGRQTSSLLVGGTGFMIKMAGDMFYPEYDSSRYDGDSLLAKVRKFKDDSNRAVFGTIRDFGQKIEDLSEKVNSSEWLKADEKLFAGGWEDNPNLHKAVDLAMSGVSSLVGMYVLGRVSNPYVALTMFSGIDAKDLYEEAREKGVSKGKAFGTWTAGTAGTAVLEKFGFEKVFGAKMGASGIKKVVDASKKTSSKIAEAFLAEGSEEGLQTFWQNLVAKVGYDESRDLFQNVIESFIGGSLGGGLVSSFNFGYEAFKSKANKAGLSEQEQNNFINVTAQAIANHPELIDAPLQENMKKNYASFQQMIEEMGDTPEAERLKETKKQLDEVYNRTYEQLKDKVPEKQAKAVSDMARSSALFFADLEGMSVGEWFEKNAPKFEVVDNLGVQGNYQTAYAGSQEDYDVPSLDKIGSNTNVLSQGYGLYYTTGIGYAEKYRIGLQNLQYGVKPYGDVANYIVEKFHKNGITIDQDDALRIMSGKQQEVAEAYKDSPQIKDAVSNLNVREVMKEYGESQRAKGYDPGQIHEVDLPESEFLINKDSTISGQSKFVKDAIKKIPSLLNETQRETYEKNLNDIKNANKSQKMYGLFGRDYYRALSDTLGSDEKASAFLRRAGIKGMEYDEPIYDGHAFVVFDPKDVKVLNKLYGGEKRSEELVNSLNEIQIDASYFQVADENQRLDDIYPAYEGETININGQEKTVYNSNGDRIAKSKEALENFYKWFGDSKVVDEQGRPLVVYHGTKDVFGVFSADKGSKYDSGYAGSGFYFTSEEGVAKDYAEWKKGDGTAVVMPVYLNIHNPLTVDSQGKGIKTAVQESLGIKVDESPLGITKETSEKISNKAKEKGYDGISYKSVGGDVVYVAFNPNQIKSTSNRGTYSESENIHYQESPVEERVKNYTDRDNPTRIKQRTLDNLLPEEKDAFDRFVKSRKDGDRILKNLEANKYDDKGNLTGYYRTAVEDVFIQQAIMDYVNGREVNYESAIDVKTRAENGSISTIKAILQSNEFKSKKSVADRIEYLADSYIDGTALAHPAKVVNAVNSSLLNCNPSKACAIFCYATHGNYARGSYNLPKSEVIDIVARYHPQKLAQIIAKEYKLTTEYNMGKALRLFDKGDGDDHWVEVAKELNKQGVRVAIFTKRPEFMRKINELKTKDGKEINLTMLSIDSSNEGLAQKNTDLKVAYVYQGEQNLDFVKGLQDQDRLSVVLPVKLDGKTMSKEEVAKLKDKGIETKKICPIDAGWLKISSSQRSSSNVVRNGRLEPAKVGTWNCALCDRMGGVGCYFGRTTEELIAYLRESDKNDLKVSEKDVNIIIKGFEETLKRQTITEGLTNEQLKQFGITEQDVEKRTRLLSATMGESNARNFAGFSLLLDWFGQRHTDVQQSAENKATETGLLPSKARPVAEDQESARAVSEGGESAKRESSDNRGVLGDISANNRANVRLTQYQSAFAGSRVDYDRPSLEAIGSGEGAQAHGWGLYYALNRDVAEYYRETLAEPDISYEYDGDAKLTNAEIRIIGQYGLNKAIQMAERQLDLKIAQGYSESDIEEQKAIVEKLKSVNENDIKKIVKENKGQVHEVDIPENPYLLDEELTFRNQSEFVQNQLKKLVSEENLTDKFEIYQSEENPKYNILENSDGEEIYKTISEALGSDKAASQLLEKYGIKGITYEGRQDGRCFVIFNPADVKVIQKFYQGEQSPLGAYVNRIIYLSKHANASTLPHELFHFWSDMLHSSKSERAKEILREVDKWANKEFDRKYSTIKTENGYAVVDKSGKTVYDRMGEGFATEEQARAYAKEELFARGFEKYLSEGKAPSKTLRQAFANFYNWLKKIYVDMMSLDIKLSKPMRDVYATILGGTSIDTFLDSDIDEFIEKRAEAEREKDMEVREIIQQAQGVKPVTLPEKIRKAYEEFDFGETWKKIMIPLSTRAKRVAPTLRNKIRRYEFDVLETKQAYYREIEPMLKKWKEFSKEDNIAFDLALKNGATDIRDEILRKYNAADDFAKVTEALEDIYYKANDAGLEVGYIEDYFPRKVKDKDGLLSYLHGTDEWSGFQEALHREDPHGQFSAEEQAEFIDKYLRGIVRADLAAYKYSSEKARKLDTIDNVLNQYYADSMQALIAYIDGMNARISTVNFFGRNRENVDESIGEFVAYLLNNNEIKPSQVDEVKSILNAVFKRRGVGSKWIKAGRDMSYIYTMGGVNTAITQLDDIFVAAYKGGVINTFSAAFQKDRVTKKDLGLDSIAAEFVEGSGVSKAVNWVFKHNGIELIDGFGKNALLNGVLKKMEQMSDADLRKYLEPIMEEETEQTMRDIRNGELSANVRFFLFNELSDMQPVSLSELPELYNVGGNARIFYMLKSFMLKRIDTLRNEVYDKMRSSDQATRIEGWKNMYRLILLMMLGGATKDLIIDLMYNRDIDLNDTLVNNLLGMVGISKYNIYQVREEGMGHTLAIFATPPLFSVAEDLSGDVNKYISGKREFKDFEVFKGLPIIGRFYYWLYGGGKTKTDKKRKKKS